MYELSVHFHIIIKKLLLQFELEVGYVLGLCQCSLIGSSGIYSGQYGWPLGSYSSETIIINYL